MAKPSLSKKSPDLFPTLLIKNGLKATPQRLVVNRALYELGHATADTVHGWIKENTDTRITLASVYNILSQLADLGIYARRPSIDSKMYFDVDTSANVHMYDVENHTFREVGDEKLYQNLIDIIGSRRFKGYNIEKLDIQLLVRPSKRGRRQRLL